MGATRYLWSCGGPSAATRYVCTCGGLMGATRYLCSCGGPTSATRACKVAARSIRTGDSRRGY